MLQSLLNGSSVFIKGNVGLTAVAKRGSLLDFGEVNAGNFKNIEQRNDNTVSRYPKVKKT